MKLDLKNTKLTFDLKKISFEKEDLEEAEGLVEMSRRLFKYKLDRIREKVQAEEDKEKILEFEEKEEELYEEYELSLYKIHEYIEKLNRIQSSQTN